MPIVYLKADRQEMRDIENALRKLRNAVEKGGVLKTLQEKAQYERPGLKRNRKKAAAIARWRRELRKQQLPKKMY